MKNIFSIAGIFLILFFWACQKDKTEDPRPSKSQKYFPIEMGYQYTYKVDSVVFRGSFGDGVPETKSYQIQDRYSEIVQETDSEISVAVKRYIYENSTWNFVKNYTLTLNTNNFKTDISGNLIVKCAFPLQKDKLFDNNLFNTDEPQLAKVIALNESFQFKNNHFEQCLVVEEANNINLIDSLYQLSVYAPDTGLVFFESTNLNQIDVPKDKIGNRLTYRLINFEKK